MNPITFTKQSYIIDGKPGFLYSGEFHYFRVRKSAWRERMELFKKAGGNCIATYIPWLIHEPTEGNITFAGEDHLDLEGFLKIAQETGLRVMARPGPYQYSELVYGGLPRWLYDGYPALHARRLNGESIQRGSVSYIHPLFLEKVKRWFDAVCPLIARYTISQGGPIAFTQFDNEAMGVHLWRGSADYNPETMGFGKSGGRYTRFMQKRFPCLTDLNTAYDSAYERYEDVRPQTPGLPPRTSDTRRKKDYFEFYLGTVAEYGVILVEMMRSHGIDTPFIHNSANPDMNAFFIETVDALGSDFLLGSDHYYNLDQNWNQNNPTPQYAINVFYSNEMLRLMGFPPSIFELPGGSCSDWPPITPHDIKACVLANIALGMKGCNYYIFTGGPNPPGAGLTTDLYDYGAAIGSEGEIRPLYDVVKEIGHFVKDNSWLVEAEHVSDFRVSLDFDYARARQYEAPLTGIRFSAEQAWKFTRVGLLTTAFCSSLSPDFIDMRSDEWLTDLSTPLVVICAETMAQSKQARIVQFLKNGGRALIAPVLPRFDENLHPCTILSDYLGSPELEANDGQQVRFNCGPVVNIFDNGGVSYTQAVPASGKVLGIDEFTNKTISWMSSPTGGGKVVFLGFHWMHAKNEQGQMLSWLLKELGLIQRVICSNPNIWTTLRRHADKSMLFAMNLSTSDMEAEIDCPKNDDTPGSKHHVALKAMTVLMMDPVSGKEI